LAGVLLGGLITFLITRYSINRKYLAKVIEFIGLENYSLLSFSDIIKNEIEINYEGSSVNSISLYKFRIQNVGLESIKNQPITIIFDENTTIKKYFIKTEPEIGFGEIDCQINKNKIDFKFNLINSKDKINLELITINNIKDGYEVFGKNDNVILYIFDYKKEKEKMISLLEEISSKFSQPFSLIPYMLKIIISYPKVYKLMRIERINKKI
jgi:hypothetical protein